MKNGKISLIFHCIIMGFILAPIIMVCLTAFTDKGYISMPFEGASLRWFKAALTDRDFIDSFFASLQLSSAAAFVAVLLSVPAALSLAYSDFKGKKFLESFFLSPLMIPHVVLGITFLRFFSYIGLNGTMIGLTISHIVIIMPYALRLILTSAIGQDRSLQDCAASLGARPLTTFRRITFPLILPGIFSGFILSFINSFDEVTMTVFLSSPRVTPLPVRMYLYVEETIDPLVSAVSALLVLLAIILMLLLERFYGLEKLLVGKGK